MKKAESGRPSDNNQVKISGKIVSEFKYSHEVFNEGFYSFYLEVPRLSDAIDTVPVMVSERAVNINEDRTGCTAIITGQFRSYNRETKEGGKKRLILCVFAQEIQFEGDEGVGTIRDCNTIQLRGYICREAIYRKTPLGREITDVLLAVNRPYGKSDYLPCICWGRNARFAAELPIGTGIEVTGRIQSREYTKRFSDDSCERRIAYEVSIGKVSLMKDTEDVDVVDTDDTDITVNTDVMGAGECEEGSIGTEADVDIVAADTTDEEPADNETKTEE